MEFLTNKFISIVYLIGVLILVLPGFLQGNTKFKIIIQNLSIWVAIILVIVSLMIFFGLGTSNEIVYVELIPNRI